MFAMELAALTSEVGMKEFTHQYALLKSLRDIWASGKNAQLNISSMKYRLTLMLKNVNYSL